MASLRDFWNWLRTFLSQLSPSACHVPRPRLVLLLACLIFVVLSLNFLSTPWQPSRPSGHSAFSEPDGLTGSEDSEVRQVKHPIESLAAAARTDFSNLHTRQSPSLKDAVAEYRRRYARSPPPHFDKWYDFTQDNKVPLVDEYDGINDALRPFWGLSPSAIRQRVKRALDADDFLIGVFIRNGKVESIVRGQDWRQDGIRSAIEPYVHLLPDMDLAFNLHDEPRVIIPHDQLVQLNERARRSEGQRFATRSSWSPRPSDLNTGFVESNIMTPFLEYAHRFTWGISTLSCPPTSPARALHYDGLHQADDVTAFAGMPLGFIRDRDRFTDICLSPSMSGVHGFFNMPNAWSITHEPIPIFSPSKVSTFHDILYPAPWYLSDRIVYHEWKDHYYDNKKDSLYWRGSTTSGFSAGGVWRRQERQRFVEATEKPGTGLILENAVGQDDWIVREVERQDYQQLFDVHFSYIGQCSVEDCEEQGRHFDVRTQDSFEEAFNNKFVLDIDGNAFSGRFYSFLQSNSLTLKQALFREWHENRIVPWVHYIPLGLNGTDHLEIMRYLTREEKGQQLAREIADESTAWASASLRKVDMHAWMFRLLLEYARLIDDSRDELGFS